MARGKADYRSTKPELGTDAETQRYELQGAGRKADALELDAVDTSYLQEMGAESDFAPQRNELVKIPEQDLNVDLLLVQSKS